MDSKHSWLMNCKCRKLGLFTCHFYFFFASNPDLVPYLQSYIQETIISKENNVSSENQVA